MTIAQGSLLHDCFTRGDTLTAEEQQALDAWYREQDQTEFAMLEQAVLAPDIPALRHQLEVALQQLSFISQSINDVLRANNELRQDIAQLQRQLRPPLTGRAA